MSSGSDAANKIASICLSNLEGSTGKLIILFLFLFLFLFTVCSFYNKCLDNNFFLNDSNKIALVFPSKVVGKYWQDTINTMISYMIHNSFNFELEVFDSKSQ